MQAITDNLNIYLIPPILFLITGVSLGLFSLLKAKREYENTLFALMCFWYSLIMPVFIAHHMFKGEIELLLKIERSIHFIYVYLPAIGLLFMHTLVNKKNRILEGGAFLLSFITSLFVFSDYYFYGLWEYNWGYIAKGGVVSQFFGLFSMAVIIYGIVLFVKNIKTDRNPYNRLKIKYIMLAILAIALLTLGNTPAMNGIDFYPTGNFAFIPMLFMAWGIYRYDVIQINLYTKRRIVGAIVRIIIITGLISAVPLVWWAIGDLDTGFIINKIIPCGIPPLVSFICCVFLAFLSLRLGESQKDSILFSLLMFAYALLNIDIFLNGIITDPGTGLQISRLSHIFVVFIPAIGIHLMRSITERNSERYLLYLSYIAGIILLLFTQSPYYLQGMYIYSWGLFAKKAVMFDVMGAISFFALIYTIIILFKAYRKSEIIYYRHRFLFLLIGSASIAILTLGNIPAMNGYNIYPTGNFIFIPAAFFAIALFRHNITELMHLAGVFLHYGITGSAIITAVYFQNQNNSGHVESISAALSITGILLINYSLHWIRDYLSGDQIKHLKIAFENLNDRLSRTHSYNEIAECVKMFLFNDFLCGRCALLIQDKKTGKYSGLSMNNDVHGLISLEKSVLITVDAGNPLIEQIHTKRSPVSQEEIEYWILNKELIVDNNDPLRGTRIIVPVFFENRMSALVLIGVKNDGSVYSRDETGFLYQLGINLGAHIENAGILQRLENTVEERTKKLLFSEGKYRHFIENTDEMIYKADYKGNFIYVNPAFEKKTGYNNEEIRNLNYLNLIPEEFRQSESAFYKKQLKNKIDESHRELPILLKSGKILWVEQDVKSIKDENGEIVEFDCIAHDITDRKAAEDALRDSEMHYQQLMENVSDCVFICKLDGHLKYINSAVTRITGIPHNELIGMHFLSIVHPDYRKRQLDFYVKQVSENIEITYSEFPVVTKNNEIIWAGQTVRMIKNNEGEIEFYGITHDISNLKKAEEARQNLEDAKTRFFANISHEIRTPLTLMIGPIESVLQGNYGKEVDTEFFKNLHRNTLSLLKLVNNLLDFSKIEAGKMILNVHEADIVLFLRNYIPSIQMAGKSQNIDVNFTSSSDSIILTFDPQRMDKVIMNLLSNALKFTGSGGSVSIGVSEDDTACRLVVTDTGDGIPEKSIDAVFDRFSQADTTSTRKYGGTGIGLALARELVELHGGAISAESRYIEQFPDNHGTSFTVIIPKGSAHLAARSDVQFTEKSSLNDYVKDYRLIDIAEVQESQIGGMTSECCMETGDQPPADDKKTILVVDDNGDMRNFLKTLLQKDYHVLLAINGEDGITCARNRKPDLIVTDVMMPVMNGFEMTSIIKNDEKLKTSPVIMLTADTELMNKVAGLENGADDYIHKPFNSIELITRISSLLKNYEYQQIISRRNADIESELEVARMLQQKLLPSALPELNGYLEHATYIPMDKVGGDFYDIEKRDEFLNIFIADVSGHGLPGAFLSTVTKIALENISSRTSPQTVLQLLNDVILKYTVQSNFVTSFYAAIDTNTNILRYSSAGHFPPILYRKQNDTFIDLKCKGVPLGCFHDFIFDEKKIQLYSGDRVIFYTDGIIECRSPADELFGDERFKQIIKEYSSQSAGNFSMILINELENYSGTNKFNDDITMIVLDVL